MDVEYRLREKSLKCIHFRTLELNIDILINRMITEAMLCYAYVSYLLIILDVWYLKTSIIFEPQNVFYITLHMLWNMAIAKTFNVSTLHSVRCSTRMRFSFPQNWFYCIISITLLIIVMIIILNCLLRNLFWS